MGGNIKPLFKLLPPGLFRSSGTESVGLRADAQVVMVFASPSGKNGHIDHPSPFL